MEQTAPSTLKDHHTRPALIRAVAIIQSLYALGEFGDCIAISLMALGLLANIHPVMLFGEIQTLFDSQTGWLVPLFLFYASLRAASAIGLWRNRLWGFWLTIFVSVATLIMSPFLLPITAAEMLGNGVLIIMLLIGFFGDRPITS